MASTYKRGQTWWGRVQREGVEHRRSLRTRDRRTAEKRLRQWIEDIDSIALGEAQPQPFSEAVFKFLGEHIPTLKPSSRRRYGVSIKWLRQHWKGKMVSDVTRASLAEFEAWRRSMGAAPPTIRRDLACLSSMLTACEEWEWIEEGANPVPGYMRRRRKRGLRESPPRRRDLTEAEERRLLEAASPMLRKAIIVAIETGLRLEEQFSMQAWQVRFSAGQIETTKDTKSGRSRIVPLSDRAAQELAHLHGADPNTFAFVNPRTGDRFQDMKKGFKGAVRRASLSDLVWHDLRRTAGRRWLRRDGEPIEVVSLRLGHSSIKVTERSYAYLDEEDAAKPRTPTGTGPADYNRTNVPDR